MPTIRQLPQSVINKIAAGEVIERPASVVKELVENAIDAGATRIDLYVEKGGTECIRVVDNGCGIDKEQFHLAIASHATSKIQDADDLFNIHSLGFRGEALASISEISRFVLRSRAKDSQAGHEIEILGGERGEITPCGCPQGTSIEVRQLFFNTPVRRKFMKSTQTEMGHVIEAFTRIAMPHPHVHFTLKHNNRMVHDLPAVENWADRISALLGKELSEKLIPVESEDGQLKLYGFVGHPSETRSNNKLQYVFMNNRHIRDRALQHALQQAYRGLILTGRYPIAFLHLEIPADLVDVNVHPTKLEVRFVDSGRHYSQLLGTLRSKFLASDLTHKLEADEDEKSQFQQNVEHELEKKRKELIDWASSAAQTSTPRGPSSGGYSKPIHGDHAPPRERGSQKSFQGLGLGPGGSTSGSMLELNPVSNSSASPATMQTSARATHFDVSEYDMDAELHGTTKTETEEQSSENQPSSFRDPAGTGLDKPQVKAMQVCNRYLISEDEDGLLIIDQHALHERVLYEQIRERVLNGSFESQKLLVPEPVDLTAEEAATLNEHQELLKEIGFEIEQFGQNTIAIRSYPALLSDLKLADTLRGLIPSLETDGSTVDRRQVLDELMHMMSCKAAVKAGDPLQQSEIESLLELRHLAQDAHHCPHGRPTSLLFTKEDLDKQFKRT